jgi:hypothetical protein
MKTDLRPLHRLMGFRFFGEAKSISHLFAAKLSALRECITSIRYAAQGPNPMSTFEKKIWFQLHSRLRYFFKKLTPRPLKKRHMRLKNKPNGPSINLFTKPKTRRDKGIITANGSRDALKRSSGYQTPPRFLRHLITVESEILPTIAAPTRKKLCQNMRLVRNGFHERIFPIPVGMKQAPTKASLGML